MTASPFTGERLQPVYVHVYEIAERLGVKPVTIRSWASRGLIRRHGTDHKGRTLYDYAEVMTLRTSMAA